MPLLLLILASGSEVAMAFDYGDIMRSVVRVSGVDTKNEPVMGTAFLVQANDRKAWLLSAAHFFDLVSNDRIEVQFRRSKQRQTKAFSQAYQIRVAGANQYVVHPGCDLAALLLELPSDSDSCLLAGEMVADEETMSHLGPGQQLLVFGFPYGQAFAETGNCIIRSGIISSGPLVPASHYPWFPADFEVFAGYSGAPVFAQAGGKVKLVGMALEEMFLEELRPGRKKTMRTSRGLGLAKILHPAIIREFIVGLQRR